MLDRLSKHDAKWRKTALTITNDKSQADDLVQEMYLRFYRNPKEQFTDWYVYRVMVSIYLNEKKQPCFEFPIDDFSHISEEDIFEPNDFEKEILERIKTLEWYKQELIEENYDKSIRQISNDMELIKVNHKFIHDELTKARKEVLGDDFENLYNNSRLKYKK